METALLTSAFAAHPPRSRFALETDRLWCFRRLGGSKRFSTRLVPRAAALYGIRNCAYIREHMIRSFKDLRTRRFFEGRRVAAFHGFSDQAVRRLTLLDSAETLADLAALPSNRLKALRGDRAGRYSIRINAQWRVCFLWTDDGPGEVEIVDYH